MEPELYIIAGPNGAGKSTYSSSIIPEGVRVFDLDDELRKMKLQHPEMSSSLLSNNVTIEFDKACKEAIRENKSFAFETNLHSYDSLKLPEQFKNAGFKTHLYFIGLESAQDCKQRVKIRTQKGLHNVDPNEIELRYAKGLNNLEKAIPKMDTVSLFDNTIPDTNKSFLFAKFENGMLQSQSKSVPTWAKTKIKQLDIQRFHEHVFQVNQGNERGFSM